MNYPRQPLSRTLPALLVEIAARQPDLEAIVGGGTRIRWGELASLVEEAARGLAACGVQAGDKVALLMGNRPEWIVASLAITRLGAVVVAMNTWWMAREIAYALQHSESVALICTASYLKQRYGESIERLRGEGELPALRKVIGVGGALPRDWIGWEAMLGAGREQGPRELTFPAPGDVAFLLYTSGSTSSPKGVQLAHQGLVENVWNIGERMGLHSGDRVWLAVSLFWGLGCSNALMAAMTHGSCIVLQESFEAGEALALIERERCTVLYATPNMVQAMDEHPDRTARKLDSLRTGITIGTPDQIMRAVKLGAAQICNVYGLTEIYGNCHVAGSDLPVEVRATSVGPPLPGVSHKIADLESGRPLPAGETGEIRVKGYVTPGYYKNAEATAQALDEEGYFRTGDLGLVDARGYLHYQGRIKEMVKTGGMNVAPAEIESVLMAHPDVALAVVTGVPDHKRDELLAAVIVPKAGRGLKEEDIRSYCRQQLAGYKVPRLICFAPESALPLTTTGKVQKNRIAATFFAGHEQ